MPNKEDPVKVAVPLVTLLNLLDGAQTRHSPYFDEDVCTCCGNAVRNGCVKWCDWETIRKLVSPFTED